MDIDFKASISGREGADYHYTYSKEIAEHELKITKDFLIAVKNVLNK